jgi:hypothetical protein
MRYANAFILPAVVVLTMLAILMTPSCVETILRPGDDSELRRTLRKTCEDTLAKYHARYSDLPVEEWPSEGDRLTYTNAKRILAEMDNPSWEARGNVCGGTSRGYFRSY